MGYATKRVKKKRHNHNHKIMVAAALGGAKVVDWYADSGVLYGSYWILTLPDGRWGSRMGGNAMTLWKHAAKALGVRF